MYSLVDTAQWAFNSLEKLTLLAPRSFVKNFIRPKLICLLELTDDRASSQTECHSPSTSSNPLNIIPVYNLKRTTSTHLKNKTIFSKRKCYKCRNYGHLAAECPQRSPITSPSSVPASSTYKKAISKSSTVSSNSVVNAIPNTTPIPTAAPVSRPTSVNNTTPITTPVPTFVPSSSRARNTFVVKNNTPITMSVPAEATESNMETTTPSESNIEIMVKDTLLEKRPQRLQWNFSV